MREKLPMACLKLAESHLKRDRHRHPIIFAVCAALALTSCAAAPPPQPAQSADELIGPMMAWASASTGLPLPAKPPTIAQGGCGPYRILCTASGSMRRPEAAYWSPTKTVHLSDRWELDDLRDRSILLHEIVHHAQWEAGTVVEERCSLRRGELQAFAVQMAWLQEQGITDPMKYVGLTRQSLRELTTC